MKLENKRRERGKHGQQTWQEAERRWTENKVAFIFDGQKLTFVVLL